MIMSTIACFKLKSYIIILFLHIVRFRGWSYHVLRLKTIVLYMYNRKTNGSMYARKHTWRPVHKFKCQSAMILYLLS